MKAGCFRRGRRAEARAVEPRRRAAAEEESARALLARLAEKDWSLCDGISFALIEARGVGAAFSFDHHFAQRGRFRVLGLG